MARDDCDRFDSDFYESDDFSDFFWGTSSKATGPIVCFRSGNWNGQNLDPESIRTDVARSYAHQLLALCDDVDAKYGRP